MSLKNTATGWGVIQRALHWASAVLILGLLAVGFYMVEVIGDDIVTRYALTQDHKSFGFIAFCLGVARILWRLMNPTPPLPDHVQGPSEILAKGGHLALYVLIIAMPVSGWLMATSSPFNDPDAYIQVKNEVFGLFELPDPYPKGDEALSKAFGAIHFYCALALVALLVGHVAAALKHHLVDKDNVLRRMVRGH